MPDTTNAEAEPKQITWLGRNIEELSREELLEALQWSASEIDRLRGDLSSVRPHVDWGSYLRR